MRKFFCEGENVCHRTKPNWGIGKVTAINTCGSVRVIFEGNRILSIANGIKYLIRVDSQGKEI